MKRKLTISEKKQQDKKLEETRSKMPPSKDQLQKLKEYFEGN